MTKLSVTGFIVFSEGNSYYTLRTDDARFSGKHNRVSLSKVLEKIGADKKVRITVEEIK